MKISATDAIFGPGQQFNFTSFSLGKYATKYEIRNILIGKTTIGYLNKCGTAP